MGWSRFVRASVGITLAAALCAVGGVGTASADTATTPPFTQCAPVGYDRSCSILLDVDADNSVSVLTDPSVGPFDGADDTLVGIVNDSTAPVTAVTVTGPGTDLSGFDYDGLCDAYYGDGSPLGCPFGPTGYEGPGTSLRTDPSLPDEAEVDFSPALRPGQSAYFSLEGALAYAQLTARQGGLQQRGVQVLFVHGLAENNQHGQGPDDFSSLFDRLQSANPGLAIKYFDYYQDADCDGGADVPVPSDAGGMPVSNVEDPNICDSDSDLGLNALKLDQQVQAMAANGDKVILVGYSMGATIIRGMLAYSQAVGDGVAANMVDSVFTLHGVQEGSFGASLYVHGPQGGVTIPGTPVYIPNSLWWPSVQQAIQNAGVADPFRPGVQELQPKSQWFRYVNPHSMNLASLPTYNTYGDMALVTNVCIWACVTTNVTDFGDLLIEPGSDQPTALPAGGGAEFLPGLDQTSQHYEWSEYQAFSWNFLTGREIVGAVKGMANSPLFHLNYRSEMDEITVPDCSTHQMESETTALFNVLNGRVTGRPYPCSEDTSRPPGAPSAAPGYFGS